MPQLNPAPWLCYFLMTWFILMSLAPQKILAHINLNKFNIKKTKTFPLQTWTWTW
uniref:ATP synthase complex subunit 8 n=2 Tax=Odorrana TaxID=121155 RepID=A0A7H1KHM9_9NEOB|nr:ATP synthase F0 subunit 8 [Odorrana livida]YP_009937324.1 ATP synthase F0 subunit 8 [Odorrana graminea]ARO35550.1 ATP synthase F0 subunit 8 [Odorrana livida]QNT26795.1 ATP synthase F0 subunit 8 [Odorrana graminea]